MTTQTPPHNTAMDTQDTACGCSGNPRFDGLDPGYKRILWIVILINAAMFIVEMSAGKLAGSQALQADALDFLGDALTYGLSLAVIFRHLHRRQPLGHFTLVLRTPLLFIVHYRIPHFVQSFL